MHFSCLVIYHVCWNPGWKIYGTSFAKFLDYCKADECVLNNNLTLCVFISITQVLMMLFTETFKPAESLHRKQDLP